MQPKHDPSFRNVGARPSERLNERLSSALSYSQRFPVIQMTSFGPFNFSGLTDEIHRGFDYRGRYAACTEADVRDRISVWVNEGGAEAQVRP